MWFVLNIDSIKFYLVIKYLIDWLESCAAHAFPNCSLRFRRCSALSHRWREASILRSPAAAGWLNPQKSPSGSTWALALERVGARRAAAAGMDGRLRAAGCALLRGETWKAWGALKRQFAFNSCLHGGWRGAALPPVSNPLAGRSRADAPHLTGGEFEAGRRRREFPVLWFCCWRLVWTELVKLLGLLFIMSGPTNGEQWGLGSPF